MDSTRKRKNKNAVVQYSSSTADPGTFSGKEKVPEHGQSALQKWDRPGLDEPSKVASKGLTSVKPSDTESRHPSTYNISDKTDFETVIEAFNETAHSMVRAGDHITRLQQDVSQIAKAQDSVGAFLWPGNADTREENTMAENDAFLKEFNASQDEYNNGGVHGKCIQGIEGKHQNPKPSSLSQKTTDFLLDNRNSGIFKDSVDEPAYVSPHQYSHQQRNQIKGKPQVTNLAYDKGTSSAVLAPGLTGNQQEKYTFKDMQASFEQDGKIPDASNNPDKDDPFEHPDWQFLNEFSDQTVTNPAPQAKPRRNKNTIAGSMANGTGFGMENKDAIGTATALTGQATGFKSKYLETTKTLSELVLKEGLVVKDMFPDGNCLFAAIADQLHVRGEFFYTTTSLREAAVKYLTDHPCQEDGTHLQLFLTEHDGKWEEYLARMSREGEWGDHFVISALANVLNRRLIIMRGFKKLNRTIMEPSKFNSSSREREADSTSEAATGHDDSVAMETKVTAEGSAGCHGDTEHTAAMEVDDLYLGHIAEAHYVSLRHADWLDKFNRKKKGDLPSFLHYGGDLAKPDVGYQEKMGSQQSFPEPHLNFLLKYIHNVKLFTPMIMCSSVKEYDKYSSILIGQAFYGFESVIVGSYNSQSVMSNDFKSIALYMVPHDTLVAASDKSIDNLHKKDLVAEEADCPHGYTRLCPVLNRLWSKATLEVNNTVYLKQLFCRYDIDDSDGSCLVLALKSTWPKCADEFLTRDRPSNWPKPAKLQILKRHGVHVISEASRESDHPDIEWKFSFNNAKRLLCRGMGDWVRHSFYCLCTVNDFLLEGREWLNHSHLMAVFFYCCEELPEDQFADQPWTVLLYMLKKLQTFLEQKFLPDYFVREQNMIAGLEEAILEQHSKQLMWFQNNVVEGLFLLLDRYHVMELLGLQKCFESLITDGQKFTSHQSKSMSYMECFLPLSILSIQTMVKDRKLEQAVALCEQVFQECTAYYDSIDGTQEILQKVLDGQPLQEQWLFAFYMDYSSGSGLLIRVCRDRENVPLSTYFGEEFVQYFKDFSAVPALELQVPVVVVFSENLAAFAYNFLEILFYDISVQAFKAAAHFFLKNFSRELIETIAREEKAGDYHTGHSDTKAKLYSIFSTLYNRYNLERDWMEFQDLMEVYDLLSRHYRNSSLNYHVAELWEYYGDFDKFDEALARYKSI